MGRPAIHGMCGTKVYQAWRSMKQRCRNPNHKQYADYGGRNIDYHPDFESFENFYTHMGDPPKGYTLDRIDNELGYTYGNLRWADRSTQNRNKRKLKNCTSKYRGVTWYKLTNKWLSQIRIEGKQKHIGLYESEVDAAQAYDNFVIQHGIEAQLNFPELSLAAK